MPSTPPRPAPTPAQTIGPFFGYALPFAGDSEAVEAAAAGSLRVEGRLLDGAGEPVSDGLIELWQGQQFGRCRTDPEGVFHFTVRKPPPMSGPDNSIHAPHLNVTVHARGLLRNLATRMYFSDEVDANSNDWLLGQIDPERRPTLVGRVEAGVVRFDIHLQGAAETVFFAI